MLTLVLVAGESASNGTPEGNMAGFLVDHEFQLGLGTEDKAVS